MSFVLIMVLIGFFSLLIIKIGPIYLDHYKVVASLEALKSDQDLATKSRQQILTSLGRRWNIDMIDSVKQDNVYVTKDPYSLTVEIAYDVTKPVMGNIDVVVHFDDSIEVAVR